MSAQTELCAAPVADIAARRAHALTVLYELRLHVANLAHELSRTHNLSAALHVATAEQDLNAAISRMELQHPELT